MRNMARKYVSWPHGNVRAVPAFAHEKDAATLKSRSSFLAALNNHVIGIGLLIPVRLFRQRLQDMYIKSKGGVACAALFRSELSCSGSAPGWEQKLMLLCFKQY